MDYEKAYKEALERAKNLCDNSHPISAGNIIINSIFPELKESKDDKTRKELTEFLKSASGGFLDTTIQCKTFGKWLAWLEKQGEQKSNKEFTFKALPRLLDMIEPTDKAKAYCQKLIDSLENEGYTVDAKIVGECLKGMNGEKVAMATMDEQKPAWSEEDEDMLKSIIATCELAEQDRDSSPARHLLEMQADWLKSLKDRVLPQPKQEWSEEDETNSYEVIKAIKANYSSAYAQELTDWLKSLRPQTTWKPSDEQIEALKGVQEGIFRLSILESLYNDLKKLMEE